MTILIHYETCMCLLRTTGPQHISHAPNFRIIYLEKKADLVHEVASDVRFSHEVAEHKIPVTKLPRVSVLVSL